ncbi:MAG TPA: sodium:proton exchanger [Chloroflexia bacterium]|nr:sodium:proton exchanger [Chloroflexia bacterium]
MRRFVVAVVLALGATVPGMALRLTGLHLSPLLDTMLFAAALLGAGFLLSWGAETAEHHVSQGLAIAGLALITVLPEYAVDIYYAYQGGQQPASEYVQFAAANMTGANRLLIGLAWPLIVLLYWWRSGRRTVPLRVDNTVEIAFLALASLYAFVIVVKGRIDLWDMAVLVAIFAAYLWRVGKLPPDAGEEDVDVGPAAALEALPASRQWAIIAALAVLGAGIILTVAAPFAESLIASGAALGVNKFLLIQWIAPLAGEAPEIILTILFTLTLRPTLALGALVSDKINQWTLLVGMIPLFYSLGAGRVGFLPLDARQREEFFLTAAQSVFAVALLLALRLTLWRAVALFGLFAVQLGLAFVFRADEPATITSLTALAWLYLLLAAGVVAAHRGALAGVVRVGLFNQSAREPRDPEALPPAEGGAPAGADLGPSKETKEWAMHEGSTRRRRIVRIMSSLFYAAVGLMQLVWVPIIAGVSPGVWLVPAAVLSAITLALGLLAILARLYWRGS